MTELPREIQPPAEVRRRIERQLRGTGMLRSRTQWYAIAAAVVVVIAAALLWMRAPKPPQPNYILLLYESAQFTGGSHAEYARWAQDMRPLVVGGEELGKDVASIGPGAQTAPAGYFLIDAKDDAAALRVARACPHLRHGGAVVLRRIVM